MDKTIKLIDYGAMTKILQRKPINSYSIYKLLDGKDENTYKANFAKNNSVYVRHGYRVYQNHNIASDLYVVTDNPEIINMCASWITEVKNTDEDNYVISSKDYYVIPERYFTKRIPLKIRENARKISITSDPLNLSLNDQDNSVAGYMIMRSDIEDLMDKEDSIEDNIMTNSLLSVIDVYHQDEKGFTKSSLTDSLDKLKTEIENYKSAPKTSAKKMEIFCLLKPYDMPTELYKRLFINCDLFKFTPNDISENGMPIYHSEVVHSLTDYLELYYDECLKKGITLTFAINDKVSTEDLETLKGLNLIKEYEVLDDGKYLETPMSNTLGTFPQEKTLN